ncbi:MAG TPA: penicillin-binding protein activator, partial [Woeseiaceae bacterium]|nr:penicillin-binding protein activator [Woeseiaceae bacterium]
AFAASLDEAGGRLLDYRRYQPGVADFSDTIEDLLLLDESIRRYRRLRSVVGESVQFEPRRRGDIDFIFLAADGTTARLLRPQLRFHYAGNLPVYATSAVNERDGRSNNDLNGILFPEVPWIVSERSEVERVRSTYAELWPGSSPLSRLHAMGYDAYRLVGALQRAADGLEEPLQGMTGELTMDRRGVVHRRLPLATFEQGEIVAVAEPLPDIGDEAERPPGIDILLRDSDGAERPAAWDAQTDSD